MTRRGGLPAQLNDFWAARGREAGETAADRVLVACREVIDDAEGIALLDARRKHIGVAEPVLRKRVPRALWGIWPRGQAAECVIAAVAAIVLARDVDDLPVISGAFSNSLKLYPRAQFLFFLRHEE